MPEQDAPLVAALCSGHPGAPGTLVDRYGRYVERLLVRVVGLTPDLPDLLHEVFTRALERVHEIQQPESLKAWLGSLTIYTARAWLRNRRFRRRWLRFLPPAEVPDAVAPDPEPEVQDALRRVYRVLENLPVDERVAFSLRFMDGMGLRETAELCGVSLATIKRRLGRAEARFLADAGTDPLLRERIERGERWRSR
jgi:RNA polymerase sigma-70 factor (ECF subfamily)